MRGIKSMLAGLAILAGIIILAGAGLGILSQKAPELGVVEGRLMPCPDSPNCVCSEGVATDEEHFIEPIAIRSASADAAWKTLIASVQGQGGSLVRQSDDYLLATFTSNIFRFKDDVEFRMDRDAGVIHLRSASRVGHSDFDANRKRIEGVRKMFESLYVEH